MGSPDCHGLDHHRASLMVGTRSDVTTRLWKSEGRKHSAGLTRVLSVNISDCASHPCAKSFISTAQFFQSQHGATHPGSSVANIRFGLGACFRTRFWFPPSPALSETLHALKHALKSDRFGRENYASIEQLEIGLHRSCILRRGGKSFGCANLHHFRHLRREPGEAAIGSRPVY